MTREEKMQWWNSLTLEQQLAHYEKHIQELKNKLYVDGKYEWVRDYEGEYPVFRYNKGLSTQEKNTLEKRLKELHFSRSTVSHRISMTKFWNNHK